MHFYESSILTTKDGLYCQVYDNEHPTEGILVKPKYIPTDKIESNGLPYRFIAGRKMNRLNLWGDKEKLKEYIEKFKQHYPSYIYTRNQKDQDSFFFMIPIDHIERVYFPRHGLNQLMKIPRESLDPHLTTVHDFIEFLVKSGVSLEQMGITYSTLMGHYSTEVSDMNIVIYGKENYWKLMKYLETTEHPLLRWKTEQEWLQFRKQRNRLNIFTEKEFLDNMGKKKTEGYFNKTLFLLFAVEKEKETWCPWGSESYERMGTVTVTGTVTDDYNSIVRPGYYEVKETKILTQKEQVPVRRIVFYSRDYCMLASKGEKLRACGLLEKVIPHDGSPEYYRVVVGYFDAYISERREQEYIKKI